MTIDTSELELACDELTRTMQYKNNHVDELEAKTIVQGYLNIAINHAQNVQDMGLDPNIVARAIRYINHALAIPPLKGNMQWFDTALNVLIDITCPISVFDKDHEEFLKDIEQGLRQIRANYVYLN